MNKNVLIYLLFFVIFTSFLNSTENLTISMNLIKSINCNSIKDLKKFNISRFVLISKSGKKIKEIKGTFLNQIIQKELSKENKSQMNNLIFRAISKSGESVGFTYNEISDSIAKIPIIIGFLENTKFKDSIEVSGFEGTKLNEKQKSKFDEIFTNFQVLKVYLQMKNISKEDVSNIFQNVFIIFPMDLTTGRFLGNLDRIEIYKLN